MQKKKKYKEKWENAYLIWAPFDQILDPLLDGVVRCGWTLRLP